MGLDGFTAPQQLPQGDVIKNFNSGLALVDEWAAKYAAKAREKGTAVVYVTHPCVDGKVLEDEVAGFYTLSSHSVARVDISGGWLKRNAPVDVPAILLGMLGVDSRYQKMGLGADLLRDALVRSARIADELGARALVVQPADSSLEAFYKKYGFSAIAGTDKLAISLKISSAS